jgi:2-aminoadipate transaminase
MIDYDALLSRAGRAMQQSEIRKMGTLLAQSRNVVSFAPGYPDPETFAWDDLQAIMSDLLAGRDGRALQYGPTRGNRPLLEAIAAISAGRHIEATPENLLVTTGSQQGLDLLARVLLDPGDVVLVELPSYTGAITAFRILLAQLGGAGLAADGIDLDDLDAVLTRLRGEGRRVRFLYVVPNFQNPTGLLLGRRKRERLLDWAARRDVLIVEDDPYCDLYFEDAAGPADTRPIKADDREGRVIYLSSFSKTLAPGFRVAWLNAPAALVSRVDVAKQAADLCTPAFGQHIVYEACRRGVLERRVPLLRQHYQRKRNVMQSALTSATGGTLSWTTPRGGFFLWATLPSDVDADRMLERAVRHGVIYVAGAAFFVDGGGRNTMRLSFSAPPPEGIVDGVTRLAAAIREARGTVLEVPS